MPISSLKVNHYKLFRSERTKNISLSINRFVYWSYCEKRIKYDFRLLQLLYQIIHFYQQNWLIPSFVVMPSRFFWPMNVYKKNDSLSVLLLKIINHKMAKHIFLFAVVALVSLQFCIAKSKIHIHIRLAV